MKFTGQQLVSGAAKPARTRPNLPPLDSGKGVRMMHECQIKKKEDEFSWVEQYLVQCKCHMGDRWVTWRPGDPEFICPLETKHDRTSNVSKTDA